MFSKSVLSLLTLASAVAAQQCPIQFDGRIGTNATAASFDTSASPFSPTNVFGQNLTLSQLVQLPNVDASLFDTTTRAVEITLSDASIFAPSATNIQTGFRRAELLPASNNGTDPSTTGIKTLHFSIMKDCARPLNLSHEYQLVFLESADFSTNQVVLKTGTISGQPAGQSSDLLVVQSNVNEDRGNLFMTNFTDATWHNFGLVLDFTRNTTQILYSTDSSALTNVTTALPNNISGQGQFHFGVLKKPTGDNLTDVTKQGFQESGIDEGIIYGGIFEEDSSAGCISLSPI